MKVLIPREGYILVCERCKKPIAPANEATEDGALDFPFCPRCLDFVTGLLEPSPKNKK